MNTQEQQSKENNYLIAKERVAEMKKFYMSLFFYIIFISFLAGLNYYINQWSYMWFLWAAFGWGIGLVFQAIKSFNWVPFLNKNWEERKIKELMEKDDQFSNQGWK